MKHLFTDRPGDEGLPGSERRLAAAALILGTMIAVLDGSIVNVALPVISHQLGVAPADAVWVASAYLVAGAMTLLAFAALGEVIGYARVYVAGLIVFTLTSLACALSTTLSMLVAMRLLQGLGGAAAMSLGPALYRHVFPTRLLGSALGINALTVASATAAGPALGGFLLEALSWPWLFAINVPLGTAACWLAHRSLPRITPKHSRLDLPSVLYSAVAMGALVVGVDSLSQNDASAHHGPSTVVLLVIALLAGIIFVRRQRRTATPLLPLDIFSSPRFSLAALTSLCSFTAQGTAYIALPFLFQGAMGFTALQSAALFTPWPLAIVIAAPLAGRLADRYDPAMLSTAGLAVLSLGLGLLALLDIHASALDIGWRAFVCGLGFGFFQSPNNRELLSSAPRTRSATASGVLATARTFGQSLGAALVGIVLAWASTHQGNEALLDARATHVSMWVAAAASFGAMWISLSRIRRARDV
ncbi:MFS transporter [Chitinasiproducens palmae]|uniref:MFS transporter, DHA2 family, multidrug resistance protein n=1 Tax=Chitinasiproducens palmae TaxID=1770053 RepID=A0A1H2PQN5_9BURK|nr:MFS transporter [Chitinasiproducens palmae]SDV49148.1 MFS transporter, DHA2 family, multidrug resistance protein [Chitinasiproducens palmae]